MQVRVRVSVHYILSYIDLSNLPKKLRYPVSMQAILNLLIAMKGAVQVNVNTRNATAAD